MPMLKKGYTPNPPGGYIKFPLALFDEVMPRLRPNSWRALCFIIRKTVGFQKDYDAIALKQIKDGIGLSSPNAVIAAVRQLEELEYIVAVRGRCADGTQDTNSYILGPSMKIILGLETVYENHTDNTRVPLKRETRERLGVVRQGVGVVLLGKLPKIFQKNLNLKMWFHRVALYRMMRKIFKPMRNFLETIGETQIPTSTHN